MVRSGFEVLEPDPSADTAPATSLDLVLVPGLAWNSRGARLGQDSGYYDRTLTDVRGVKVMLAFSCQEVDGVPEGPHDHRADHVVTEEGRASGFR